MASLDASQRLLTAADCLLGIAVHPLSAPEAFDNADRRRE